MAIDLFASANKAVKPSSKKTEYLSLVVDATLQSELDELQQLINTRKANEAREGALEQKFKQLAANRFMELYKELGRNPGGLEVTAPNSQTKLLISFKDAYSKPDDERATELRNLYGKDIVTTKTRYFINSDILEKYQQEISDALVSMFNRMALPVVEKEAILSNLIEKEEVHSITKGAINAAASKGDIDNYLVAIQPQMSISDRTGK